MEEIRKDEVLEKAEIEAASASPEWKRCAEIEFALSSEITAAYEQDPELRRLNAERDSLLGVCQKHRPLIRDVEKDFEKCTLKLTTEANNYFSSNSERQCQGTAYCHAQGAPKSKDTGNCWWWLRTLNSAFVAAVVDDEGPIEAGAADNDKNNSSSGGDYVTCEEASVRPTIWIDL